MEILGFSLPALALALAMLMIGAAVQGSLGFGLGLISAPVLVLIDPTLVPGVVIAVSLPVALLVAWRERAAIDLSTMRWAIIGRFPGSFVGGWAIVVLSQKALAIAFGLSILLAVVLSVKGWQVTRTPTTMLTAGFLSGVAGTATSIGGPPMAIVYQRDSGPELRAAMAIFMVFAATFSLALIAGVGKFGTRELTIAVILSPAAVIGFLISRHTTQFLDRGHSRTAVLGFAASAAVVVLIRAFVSST